jgi:hypothetical protein
MRTHVREECNGEQPPCDWRMCGPEASRSRCICFSTTTKTPQRRRTLAVGQSSDATAGLLDLSNRHALIHSCIHSFTHSFILAFTHLFIHHSFIITRQHPPGGPAPSGGSTRRLPFRLTTKGQRHGAATGGSASHGSPLILIVVSATNLFEHGFCYWNTQR